MADAGFQMNFAALKRADPYAKSIIDSATHVALYTFDDTEWEKTSVEGALFVYSRSGEPYHSLVIMNRLNTSNLIEPIMNGLELQLNEPFLLYRNSKCHIYGIWFYDKDECVRIATKLQALVKDSPKPPENSPQTPVANSNSASGPIDIFGMLSKAQDDFNIKNGSKEAPVAKAPDMTSQSVMDFFAKAGGGTTQMPPVSSLPSPGVFGQRPADNREAPLLLQRLMSNPAHSVEHIEKQQRSVTPQETCTNGNPLETSLRQNSFFKSTPIEKGQKHRQRTLSAKKASETNGLPALETELNFMHISSPKPASPLATYLNQSQDATSTSKPALMPPTMFTASTPDVRPTPEPLTRNQLLQAFNYLLKNDTDFVNKLHEAYVKSFTEKPFSVS